MAKNLQFYKKILDVIQFFFLPIINVRVTFCTKISFLRNDKSAT